MNSKAIIAGLAFGAFAYSAFAGDTVPTESMSLNFTKIEHKSASAPAVGTAPQFKEPGKIDYPNAAGAGKAQTPKATGHTAGKRSLNFTKIQHNSASGNAAGTKDYAPQVEAAESTAKRKGKVEAQWKVEKGE